MDKYYRKRQELVELLAEKGIEDQKVLTTIAKIERHRFIPDSALHIHAYENKAFPIGAKQTISHPYTVAFQTQLLDINKGDKVLEIGTGSGYQAAILAELGVDLYTIERQKTLYDKTAPFMKKMGYTKIKFYYGDGFKGKPAFAPFDKIIVTAAAPEIPTPLLDQLKIGGMLIIPVDNDEGNQNMYRIIKRDEKTLEKQEFEQFSFVPMLKGEN
ncbi:MAG: protein-L-isoaspartate(D-aspartate) O-methyltransferase [Chitinophagales bacterium]